jgi:hypothetical protein
MKHACSIFSFCIPVILALEVHSQDSIISKSWSSEDSATMGSCYRHLEGAWRFNAAVNALEISGTALIGIGMLANTGAPAGLGIIIGLPAMEMAKFTPIPLIKARKELKLLRATGIDPEQIDRVFKPASCAEKLSYSSMALVFGCQLFLGLAAIFDQNKTWQNTLLIAGGTAALASVGTSVSVTLTMKKARIRLGTYGGFLRKTE